MIFKDCRLYIKSNGGRVVKALDLSSNPRKRSWVRTPLIAN